MRKKKAVANSFPVAFQDKLWGRNAPLPLFSCLPEEPYQEELQGTVKITRAIDPSPHALLVHLWMDHILVSVSRGEALGSYCPPFAVTGMDRRRSREVVVGGTNMRAPSYHPLGDLSLSSIP